MKRTPFKRRSKFNAVRGPCANGHAHDSQAEARYCDLLHLQMRSLDNRKAADSEQLVAITPHRTVDLPFGVRWKVDFRLTYADGHEEYAEYKGVATADFRLKRKMFEATRPERLRVVRFAGKRLVEV